MKFLLVFILIFSSAATILADIRVPNTQKPKATPTPTPKDNSSKNELQIMTANVDEATLVVPQDFIKNLQLSTTDSSASPNSFAATSTVVSGIFLSLAFVFGGVFLFKNNSAKAAVSLILLGILSTSATIIYANTPPPPRNVKFDESFFTDKIKTTYYGVIGPVKVVVTESEHFRLLVPKNKQATNE